MRLLVSNQNRLYAYILYLVPHKTDADDILQETLIEMWNKFDEYKEEGAFIAWSIAIARYKVLSFRKKNKNLKVLFSDQLYELVASHYQKCGDLLERETEVLKKCMMRLPEKYKHYLLMRYEMNMPFRTIAAQVNITMQAVFKTFVKIHSYLAQCVQSNLHMENQK